MQENIKLNNQSGDEKVQKYVNIVIEAKKANKKIRVQKMMEECKKDGIHFSVILRETAKKGVWGVFK